MNNHISKSQNSNRRYERKWILYNVNTTNFLISKLTKRKLMWGKIPQQFNTRHDVLRRL